MTDGRKRRASWTIVALGVVPALMIAGIGSYVGIAMQSSVGHCIGDVEQRRQAAIEQGSGKPPSPPQQKAQPSEPDAEHRSYTLPGDPRATECPWPGADEGRVVARASLAFSFYGFLATLLFGVIGVLGIYLTYALAREEVRRRRS